jgi:hypothetical protein
MAVGYTIQWKAADRRHTPMDSSTMGPLVVGAIYEGRFRDDAIDGQGTMKMTRTMVVPRSDSMIGDDNEPMDDGTLKKHDYMIPVSFQSDMGHIHRKAGFTNLGT